ncbi:MAG: DUF2207 domain-containing protein [Candidatus Saccharimonadales bacterium]
MRIVSRLKLAIVTLLLLLAVPLPVGAGVQDFNIRSFEADYYLSRSESKRSQLKIVEKIVAEFPNFDQNHGIERAIPETYDGHSVRLGVESVKNEAGRPLDYSTYGSSGNTVLRIGDADKYVRGVQTYVITYSLKDVTKNFTDHDELFWDTNGTEWAQSFGSVVARLHIPADLADRYNDQLRCFVGAAGSTEACNYSEEKQGNETVVTFNAGRQLRPGENMTFVAGFTTGTFAPYQPTAFEKSLPYLIAAWAVLNFLAPIVMVILLIVLWRRYGRSHKGRGVIVPEYLPPKEASVQTGGAVLKKTGKVMTAQIIDLAVRHYIKIYETKRGKLFKKRSYDLELVRSPDGLREEEVSLVKYLFGSEAQVGKRVDITTISAPSVQKKIMALVKRVRRSAVKAGYFEDRAAVRKKYYWVGGIIIALGVLLLSPGLVFSGILMVIVVSKLWPLSEQGAALRDYLYGLRDYMLLAEAERLRQLQSPEGAAKMAGINPDDKSQLVKLYERLLPYAIIFGIEKQWAKEFAPLYEQQPDWYSGNWSTFNAAAFASSFNGFTSASATAFAPPTNSSSSGFSGGSSGGGGGGGGGGGW